MFNIIINIINKKVDNLSNKLKNLKLNIDFL